jgi:hypothetical protein
VTFPLPAAVLAQTFRPDYAVQVFIDAENGTILRLLLAS